MMLRLISAFCAIAALALLGWAGIVSREPPTGPRPSFLVSPTEIELGTITLGTRTLSFNVTNQDDRPRRILGVAEA